MRDDVEQAYIPLREPLRRIREELQRNEKFLRETNHFYALYQNRTYERVYQMLDLIDLNMAERLKQHGTDSTTGN